MMSKQTEALKIGDRVVIRDTAGFSKRLHGIITDFKQDKFWVLRDGADKPVWFHPDELQLEEALEQPAQDDDLMTGTWIRYNDGDDNKRLALELDIAMNGVDGAAKSPALIDVLAQAVDYFKNAKTYHILPIDDIKEHEESAYCDCYPRIEPHGLNNVVIHNSFDGREALEQPARLVSYAPDKSTCTLNIDGEEVYFNREHPEQSPIAYIKQGSDGYPKLVFNGRFEYDSITAKQTDIALFANPAPQPAQEPWGWYENHDIYDEKQSDESIALYTHPAPQPAQEPVATIQTSDPYDEREGLWFDIDDLNRLKKLPAGTKLYTNPAPSWQGLKRDDVIPILEKHGYEFTSTLYYLLDDFEQALKEKNYGNH